MTINFYTNYSEKNHLDKTLSLQGSVSGTLREDCSIINPVIKIESFSGFDLAECNYCYIPQFQRYYFINNIVCSGKLYEINCHVDVLTTYKSTIRKNSAVVSRQQNNFNLYLQDGNFKTYAFPNMEIQQFPNGFSGFNLILSVSG
jgi:hypothetical protein